MKRLIAYNMPKIELHCHLDGSMDTALAGRLLQQQGKELDAQELAARMSVPKTCQSLAEYLECFSLPLSCLQTREGLSEAAYQLALSAAHEHVAYIEVRFAPVLSTTQGLSVRQVIESVLEGLSRAQAEADIFTNAIVCAMRNHDAQTNIEMLRSAREFLSAGVAACDLAGDEAAYPTAGFADVFSEAKRLEFPFTIHAGECGSAAEVRAAIDLGARRIGHGIAMKQDAALQALCAKKGIGVEMCPTSNLQTRAIASMEDYPFRTFFDAGIPLSVNTDNRTVSGTTCTDEYMRLADAGQLREAMCEKIYQASLHMAFASDDVKQRLWEKWTGMFAF